jgi:O-antigen/teichoic acid export membrane protein
MAVLGICSYGYLSITSRMLGAERYAPLASLWTVLYIVEPAVFGPVGHILARTIASGRLRDIQAAIQSCVRAGACVLAVAIAVTFVLEAPLRTRLFDGSWVLYLSMIAVMPAMLALSLAWGYAMALHRVVVYGRLYATDGVVRLAGAVVLATFGVRSPGPYALALVAGPTFSLALNRRRLPRPPGRSPLPGRGSRVARPLTHQIATSVLAIAMLSSGPIVVKALASDRRPGDAGRFLNALAISRAPLLLAPPALTLLLPRLTSLVRDRRVGELVARMRVILLGHVFLSLALIAGAAMVGPTAIRVVYGPDYVIPAVDFVLLVSAATCFLGGQIAGQALLALHAEGRMNIGYAAGALTMACVIAAVHDLLRRVEFGLLAGTAVTLACLLLLLADACRRQLVSDASSVAPNAVRSFNVA